MSSPETFYSYPHIDNLYKNLEVLENGDIVALEKLHGTNARLKISPNGDITIGSRNLPVSNTDLNGHMGFVNWVNEHSTTLRLLALEVNSNAYVYIFGEWVGKGIQKGVHYVPNDGKDFYIFDVAYTLDETKEPTLLGWDSVIADCDRVGLKTVPELYRGVVKPENAVELFNELINRKSVVAEKNDLESPIEGVVIKPLIPALNRFGRPLLAKHKTENFSEIGKVKKELSLDELWNSKIGYAFAETFVTAERINHVLDHAREMGENVTNTMSDMKFLMKYLVMDLEREVADALLLSDALMERKTLYRLVGKIIGKFYQKILTENELERVLNKA